MSETKRPRLCLADDSLFEEHVSPPGHPERPQRLSAAREGVEACPAAAGAQRLAPRDATLDELSRAHTPQYLEQLEQISGRSGYLDADTFYTPRSFDAARRASGAAVALTDALLDDQADYGFGLLRPPGHHARPGNGMGFCLLNHAAVAARHALARGAKRVLILDWDVHHGNGTEEIFETVPEVLYISLHQSPQYPGTGAVGDIGARNGTGFTLNVPLAAGAHNIVYATAFRRLILPVIEQYAPDFTLVSAGYDAHRRDPLGGMELDAEGYAWMTRRLLETLQRRPGHRIAFLLEGGYDLTGVRESVQYTLGALFDSPPEIESGEALSARHELELAAALRAQKPFWHL
jgi:acetoin utilization deacetylase AcuC-like enzyme